MVRKVGETHREFKTRMIDPVSESFCGAKWYNATIWLGHGGTTSCHHPPAHQIDLEEIKTLQNILDIPNNKVWLMPEGVTDDELTKRRRWLMEYATEHGYNFTDRLHIIVYGDKRGV